MGRREADEKERSTTHERPERARGWTCRNTWTTHGGNEGGREKRREGLRAIRRAGIRSRSTPATSCTVRAPPSEGKKKVTAWFISPGAAPSIHDARELLHRRNAPIFVLRRAVDKRCRECCCSGGSVAFARKMADDGEGVGWRTPVDRRVGEKRALFLLTNRRSGRTDVHCLLWSFPCVGNR